MPKNNHHNKTTPLITRQRTVIIGLLIVFIVATLIADIFIHQHEHFGFEDLPGAYGLLALIGGGLLLLAAASLGPLLRRQTNHNAGKLVDGRPEVSRDD